jgi:hypothetical protein
MHSKPPDDRRHNGNAEPPCPPLRTTSPTAAAASAESRYDRATELPKLIGLWPSEIADTTRAGRLRLLGKLRRALRGERQRGLAGHWSYDLARHRQLLAAYRAELSETLAKDQGRRTEARP